MQVVQTLKRKFNAFTACQSGAIAIIFALGSVPLFAAVGAAVDYGRQVEAKSHITSALDAAALAGAAAAGSSEKQREKIAQETFKANMVANMADGKNVEAVFDIKDGYLTATADYDMPTSFMSLVGISSGHISASNEVNITGSKKVEIAFTLDYSGSMRDGVQGGVKYQIMRKAADKLLGDLDKLGPDTAKVAVVPYSDQVYVQLPGDMVLGAKGTTWMGCTVDRKYPYNQGVDVPDSTKPDSMWGQKAASAAPCSNYKAANLLAIPMTSDLKSVRNKIDSMQPLGATHTSAGVAFAYHMLTPSNPFAPVAAFKDDKVEKFLVVLTDGNQTQNAFGPYGAYSPAEGDKNLVALCDGAKAKGIHIVTVAFDVTDAGTGNAKKTVDTKTRLRNCSSDPANDYFEAKNADDVSKAFNSILNQVAQNIFLSK
jgi:Flp pilus assembly protein TadG